MTLARRLAARALIAAFGVCTIGGATGRAEAQETRDIVRDSASQVAIPGAVVSLLDNAGRALARTITNGRGEFHAVLTPDVSRIRVVRLGFQPRELRAEAGPDSVSQLTISMQPVPSLLQPVRVAAPTRCPRRSDRLAALSLLEQARAGLLATLVARSENPARMTRLDVRRTLDRLGGRIVRHEVRIDSGALSTRSYVAARPATDFVRQGFRGDSGGQHVYFAPDAEVLVDDAFASGYCFHIMGRDAARANQVGLGFRASDRRNGRVDVRGALWIDTVALALVEIEYDYVGLEPQTEPFEPGGYIAFRDMGNGVVLIDRWFIRFVAPRQDSAAGPSPPVVPAANTRLRPPLIVLVAVEGGGELARAKWADGRTWRASLGTLRLRLVTRSGAPAVGTVVRLIDTDYQAISDSTGQIEIQDLVPGPYLVQVADQQLAPLGVTMRTPFRFVAARDSVVSLVVTVPSAADYAKEWCEETGRIGARGTARLVARVVTADGQPARDARWTLRWQDSRDAFMEDAPVGPDGVFAYCNVNRGDRVTLEVRREGMPTVYVNPVLATPVTVIRVEMKPR